MQNKMKLMAPITSLETAKLQIRAGADELYCGLDSPEYNVLAFNGRWRSMDTVSCQVSDVKELGEIVKLAHKHKVTVNYCANMHYLPDHMEKNFMNYIEKGINANVDQIIVANVGVIKLLQSKNITKPIVAGTFMVITNVAQVEFLKSLGVRRVILIQNITLNEIEKIAEIRNIETEVFCHIGGGNLCGRCMLLHSPSNSDLGPGCRAGYTVKTPDCKERKNIRFLDAALDCSICSIPDLIKAKVDVVKIVGRESPNKRGNAKITEYYRKAIDWCYDGKDIMALREMFIEEELLWETMWLPTYCLQNKCRFKENKVLRSYI